MESVTLLLKADGTVASIYASKEAAEARAAAYNADPFTGAGEPDLDAPYTTKAWGLIDVCLKAARATRAVR